MDRLRGDGSRCGRAVELTEVAHGDSGGSLAARRAKPSQHSDQAAIHRRVGWKGTWIASSVEPLVAGQVERNTGALRLQRRALEG